ncbi:MFS transporter [Exiguobacterium sp. N4-1P]|uniref:DHA2 family efflux MFS transporter permease subunit n=1 Tax=Exiguobacterium sp. N4-1P TaxID=2051906 RepID=UPI000B58B426|nr:DHA2 family efflux MFS transporter permease subunit [Exiguobacterium sp. N4-1P]ASI34213.1 MFS transporter [Exiguobacterium sp. N4-1P]
MSTTFLFGYIVFMLVTFLAVNLIARRARQPRVAGAGGPALDETLIEAEAVGAIPAAPAPQAQATISTENISIPKVITVLLIGMFIAILNQTLINVALPVLINDFNVTTSTAQWLTTGFMLVNGILIPISAFLMRSYTFRRLFLVSMTLFFFGSIICSMAMNFPVMMIGRVVQAAGAGVLMPLGTNVFMTLFPPHKRGAAMGMLGIAMILAPAIGPTITGYVIQNYDWHVMFYAMAFFGLLTLLLGFAWFKLVQPLSKPKFDALGVVFSTIGFGSLLYGFSEAGNDGWDSPVVISTIVIGLLGIAAFALRELAMDDPMLNIRVLKVPEFSFTLFINVIVTMALFGGMLLLPIYLQSIRGFSPVDSGLLLLPGSLIMGITGPFAGRLFDRFGIRPLAIFGLTLMTYGTWELTQLDLNTSYYSIMGIYMLRSFGMAFIMMPIMTAGMNALPMKMIPHGNATQNTLRQVAGSIGTAILVTVMTRQTTAHLADDANQFTTLDPTLSQHLGELGQQLGSPQAASVSWLTQLTKQATINGITDAFWVATVLSALALVLSFFLHGKKEPNLD